jgi:hypothetical protein
MEFFCYHRDRPGSVALREELLEQHWSCMDQYAAQMADVSPGILGRGALRGGEVAGDRTAHETLTR